MLIQSLDPDFVFNVEYSKDENSTTSDANLKTFLQVLDKKGFHTQARPGPIASKSLLVFVKLSSVAYLELVEKDLVKNYEFGITSKDDTPADRPRLIYSYLSNPEAAGGCAITPGKGEWKFVSSITPIEGYLSDDTFLEKTKKSVLSASLGSNALKKQYGTQIAFYFEFLKFYIVSLAVLAVLGLVATFRSKNYSLTYSFVNLIWGTSFYVLWKRKERYLANFWGVQNSHKIDEYNAELTTLNKDFEKRSSYKHRDRHDGVRFVKQLTFAPVALVFTGVLVTFQLLCFIIEIFLTEIYDGPGKSLLALVPTVLISAFVPVLTIVYNAVVEKFLGWESHENNYSRNDSFVVKTFVLNFLTGYVPLLITSFIYLPFAHLIQPNLPEIQRALSNSINSDRYMYKYLTKVKSQKEFVINQSRLNTQLFFFVVTSQVIQLGVKYVLPLVLAPTIKFVTENVLGKKEEFTAQDDPAEEEWLNKVRATVQLPEHNVNDDFRGFALQYGYLILFGPVWSLAPLVSLFFNIITFKLDELKLASGKYFRPPIPIRVDSIHPWDVAFLLLTWIGSVVSPVVTAFYRHGTKPPKPLGQFAFDKASVNVSSTTFLVSVLFASEHLFFGLLFLGLKVSSYLKSKVEIDNDFVDNDIKLRRDFYSSEVKVSIPASLNDWETSPQSTLKQVQGISLVPVAKIEESKAKLSSYSNTSSDSTLTNRLDKATLLEKKRELLAKKEEELRLRQQLEQRKEKGDTIVNTVDNEGKDTLAIIDDNSHILEKDQKEVEETLAKKNGKTGESTGKTSETTGKTSETTGKNSETTAAPVSAEDENSSSKYSEEDDEDDSLSPSKKTSKKKSLKKLLKRK